MVDEYPSLSHQLLFFPVDVSVIVVTYLALTRLIVVSFSGIFDHVFPGWEYSVKDPEKGHENESDQGQVSYDDDGYFHQEEEELMEEGRIFID